MKPAVHILVSCRNPELWRASTLVFDTIRTDFPSSRIFVDGNNLTDEQCWEVAAFCDKHNAVFKNGDATIHHEWIRYLLNHEPELFVICDTDIVFHASVEQSFEWECPLPLFGRFIPKFLCPLSGAVTNERLHTSLMLIDPRKFNDLAERVRYELNPQHPFAPPIDLVAPLHYALNTELYFHDTLSQAYHIIGGLRFGENLLDRYDHINAGTYLDILNEKIPGSRARQENYLKHPEQARGLWKEQEAW